MKKHLIVELKKLAKSRGFVSVSNFIRDFELSDIASLSIIDEKSTEWKLSIRKGHSYEYITGTNFGW